MYCPSCGAETINGLSYCKLCGASLNPSPGVISQKTISPAFIVLFLATLAFATIGLVGILVTLTEIRNMGVPPERIVHVIVLVLLLGTFAVLGVTSLLTRLLWHLAGLSQLPEAKAPTKKTRAREHTNPQLSAPPASLGSNQPSVTEHTTRNFEQHYREPGARE